MDHNDNLTPQRSPVGTPCAIAKWLKKLGLEGSHEASEYPTQTRKVTSKIRFEDTAPVTPAQKSRGFSKVDEISPTDTLFSTIFDAQSPDCPMKQDDNASVTDITTLSEDEDELVDSLRQKEVGGDPFASQKGTRMSKDLLAHKKTLKSVSDPARPPSPLSIRPRTVFITSCYQCLLANMPCSRTLPSCSRCVRHGYGDLCLLHRKKLTREYLVSGVDTKTVPVLLRVAGVDDDGERWENKLKTLRELQQMYIDRRDRENWVLPSVENVRGDFWTTRDRRQTMHPGEGLGRKEFREVTLLEI